jgi:hypothetical protein
LQAGLTGIRVKRTLLVIGLVLLAVGIATHVQAVTIAGMVFGIVGFVSSGGV